MRAATTVADVALLLAGGALATLVPISDKQLDKRAARGGGRAAIERESERVEAAARRFTHAALRREGGVLCARMLAPEASRDSKRAHARHVSAITVSVRAPAVGF